MIKKLKQFQGYLMKLGQFSRFATREISDKGSSLNPKKLNVEKLNRVKKYLFRKFCKEKKTKRIKKNKNEIYQEKNLQMVELKTKIQN